MKSEMKELYKKCAARIRECIAPKEVAYSFSKAVTCKECNRIFVIRSSELEPFSARKKLISQYCPLCYKRYRAEKAAERKLREKRI